MKDKPLSENKLPNGNDSNILKEHLIDSYKDIPGETEDCVLTGPKNATATNKYQEYVENLTIELTALKLFVKEQLFVIKKQLEEIESIQEPVRQTSLQSEIEYLREENRSKTLIIKQLTEIKPLTNNCNCRAPDCNIDNINKERLIVIKNDEKSNKNLKKSEDPDKNINSGNNNDSNVTNDEFIESENNGNDNNTVKKKKDKDKKRDKVEKRLKNNGNTDGGKKKTEKENLNNENDIDYGSNENSKRREKHFRRQNG